MRMVFHNTPRNEYARRRRIFLEFSMPHFIWLTSTWFHFSETQKQRINESFINGLKIVYRLYG